jgi:Cu-processing system ATP-binding protein
VQAIGTVQSLREAAHLPLCFELEVAAGAHDSVDDAVAPLGVRAVREPGRAVSLQCPRESKMAVLAALSALGTRITDLRVREPSLEDIFLGYSS